ncbi:hypothetical protein BpHYR1_042952 [Brachionus plicatilis]|uniref:Uncharacterized protein n=1 Tax=Brachionus plicatilis TaxID=10195 RepID=A0A3M7SN22_BRAPC|nr:hypothetical protein BpHYR1_042952 [Brachionus plicatilis]
MAVTVEFLFPLTLMHFSVQDESMSNSSSRLLLGFRQEKSRLGDEKGVQDNDEQNGQNANESAVDEQVVDVDEVAVAAKCGQRLKYVHPAQDFYADVSSFKKLRNRVDGCKTKQTGYNNESSTPRAKHSAVVRVTHVHVSVHGEGQRYPDAERLGRRHNRVYVNEQYLVVVGQAGRERENAGRRVV